MTEPEPRNPLEALFRGVGLVAIACAQLEHRITELCILLAETTTAVVDFTGQDVRKNIATAKTLIPVAAARFNYIDPAVITQANDTLSDCLTVTDQRNAVIHADWKLTDPTLTTWTGARPRKQRAEPDQQPWTRDALVDLATTILQVCAAVERIGARLKPPRRGSTA